MSLNIVSLNVNGIRDTTKRNTIFQWLKSQKYDICFIQETHCTSEKDVKTWSNEWKGNSYWSVGTTMSRGVACLFKQNLDIETLNIVKDKNGRYVEIEVNYDSNKLLLLNVYSPNNPGDRKIFFNELNTKIMNMRQVNQEKGIILGGDFNCILNPCVDRRLENGENAKKSDSGNVELTNLITKNSLEDVWRRRNPTEKKYTYFRKNSKIASRIDYWLISELLVSNVTKIEMKVAPNTDHVAITLQVDTTHCDRGPGYWKMNTSIMEHDLFKTTFAAFWKSWIKTLQTYKKKKEWWEITKVKIKEISIEVAKQISKEQYIKTSKIEKELLNEKNKVMPEENKINLLTDELNKLYKHKADGARVRARILDFEEGEKSSKYFFCQEKIKSKGKLWRQIKDTKGTIKYGINNILEEQVKFYSELMSSEGWDKEAANALLKNIDVVITDEQKECCEKEISEEELTKAVKKLKTNKSPGFDGIPSEFYIKYWEQIKDPFFEVIREIEETEELCISQYRGVICLLFKQGDRDFITNWRPITLLNTDYKIIAIIYATRLKKTLPLLIKEDQYAYIEGRQITENVRLTQDIIDFTDENDSPGAIIFLDQKKAYDRVEWGYLKLCLKKFGFGPKFCNWIMMLYKGGESCIQTNGFISCFFKLSRSMRQGCPIAAYLYILQAEPMAESIRKNKNIKGIEIPNSTTNETTCIKISMFADDTQLFHRNESSIIESFKTLELYCKASGAKLNLHKTKGLYIGLWKNKTPKYNKIKWVKTVLGLGTVFGYNINYEEIWMKKFFKFKKRINDWKNRDLTIEGKKILINSYIMSSISYLADIYTGNVPENFISKTKNLVREFLWSGKTWRISQKNLGLKKCHGGIQLKDLDNFIASKKLKWIIKIHFSDQCRWNTYGKYCLSSLDKLSGQNNFLMQCSNLKGLHIKLSEFYKKCLESWSLCISKQIPLIKNDILNENIFGNVSICHKQQSIFFFNWTKSNLVKLKDIWNSNTNNWKEGTEIYNILKNKRNWIAEYNKIKACVPLKWKQILKSENVILEKENNLKLVNNIVLSDNKITIKGKEISHKKIKEKQLYNACLYPVAIPVCVQTWSRIFNENMTTINIFSHFRHFIHERKSIEFHWKVLQRAIYSEEKLKIMGKSNGLCKICNVENETLCHLLFECRIVKPVWKKMQNLLCSITDVNVIFNAKNVIIGFDNVAIPDNENVRTIYNFVTFIAKWHIWKHRNNVKYGNSNIQDSKWICDQIIRQCKLETNLISNSIKWTKCNVKLKLFLSKLMNN